MKRTLLFLVLTSFFLGSCDDTEVQIVAAPAQIGDDVDRNTTMNLREKLLSDRSLSRQAKNVKIMTIDGVVTLTGPVKSTEEKEKVLEVVRGYPDVRQVVDRIEVIT